MERPKEYRPFIAGRPRQMPWTRPSELQNELQTSEAEQEEGKMT